MNRFTPWDAEASVIGGVINNNALLSKLGHLESYHFDKPDHRYAWDAIRKLASEGKVIDELTIKHVADDRLQSGVIAQLGTHFPTENSALAHADIIIEASRLRSLHRLADDIYLRIDNGYSSVDLCGLLQGFIDRESKEPASQLNSLASVRPESVCGLPTGLEIEQWVPGGIPRGKVTVLYGETGTFKTSLANHLKFTFAKAGHRVLDVSLEDSSSLTVARYTAQRHDLPYGEIAAGTVQAPALAEEDLEVLGRILDGSSLVPRMANIIQAAKEHLVEAVFVDYVQLLDGCSGDHTALAEAMRNAQLAAIKLNVAFIMVSQVKQEVQYRANLRDGQGRVVGDPRPLISDCLGSSSLRTHAKLGLGVFRPWSYCKTPTSLTGPFRAFTERINNHPGGTEAAMELYGRTLEISVGKNVLGPSGVSRLVLVDPPTGKFYEHPWQTT